MQGEGEDGVVLVGDVALVLLLVLPVVLVVGELMGGGGRTSLRSLSLCARISQRSARMYASWNTRDVAIRVLAAAAGVTDVGVLADARVVDVDLVVLVRQGRVRVREAMGDCECVSASVLDWGR